MKKFQMVSRNQAMVPRPMTLRQMLRRRLSSTMSACSRSTELTRNSLRHSATESSPSPTASMISSRISSAFARIWAFPLAIMPIATECAMARIVARAPMAYIQSHKPGTAHEFSVPLVLSSQTAHAHMHATGIRTTTTCDKWTMKETVRTTGDRRPARSTDAGGTLMLPSAPMPKRTMASSASISLRTAPTVLYISALRKAWALWGKPYTWDSRMPRTMFALASLGPTIWTARLATVFMSFSASMSALAALPETTTLTSLASTSSFSSPFLFRTNAAPPMPARTSTPMPP
mmetsp:Transcript_67714/g.177585  ORF Transcript_67714/g.177585 Transcript_67714/m.177585 type:complete len:290 (+) Transcript_67714:1111-1980(+)